MVNSLNGLEDSRLEELFEKFDGLEKGRLGLMWLGP
jgi:hypothetical protein